MILRDTVPLPPFAVCPPGFNDRVGLNQVGRGQLVCVSMNKSSLHHERFHPSWIFV